jgi:hypothetical protein
MSTPHWTRWLILSLVCGVILAPALPAQPGPPEDLFRGPEREHVRRETRRLEAIQARHQDALLNLPRVHGMGISVDPATRELVFLLSVDRAGVVPDLPTSIEGVRVMIERSEPASPMNGGAGCVPCHANQVPLPVPMGNSTGNPSYCSACTLGFKACRNGVIYYVTNAHCSWNSAGCEGGAPIGSSTYHRGPLDASCAATTVIGSVAEQYPPRCGSDNILDAALMLSSNALTSWSIRDIGTPSPTMWASVVVGDAVQKSGRTTGLTYGTVAAVNYTTNVGPYCCGTAKFVRQIKVNATVAPFLQGGDSGSALLDRSNPPRLAGLLFAGPTDGSYGLANDIIYFISTLGLSLDPNCTAPTCQDNCYWSRDDCLETYCVWDYNAYMCNEGCEIQYQDCLASCG